MTGKVIVGMSISLDGFIAGPNDGPSLPLGQGGEALFAWYFAGTDPFPPNPFFRPAGQVNNEVLKTAFDRTGCILNGRRTYDIAGGWQGTHPLKGVPVVIMTHQPPLHVPKGRSEFRFVNTGIEEAVQTAKWMAQDLNVGISGASIAQQALKAQLVDEIHLSIAPVLLGSGRKLFAEATGSVLLRQITVLAGEGVTHLQYAVKPGHASSIPAQWGSK